MITRVFPTVLIFAIFASRLIAEEPCAPPAPPKTKAVAATTADVKASIRQDLDAYLDRRWLPQAEADKATEEILDELQKAGCTIEKCERLLRAGRADYETRRSRGS